MKMHALWNLVGGMAIVCGSPIARAEESHLLAEKGNTDYVIVVEGGASPPERTAARELQMHLEAVTGARFDMVTSQPEDAPLPRGLYVGGGERFKAAVPGVEKLGADGIRVFSQGDCIFFGGEGTRGPLYAVYTFLENEVGIRWWTPTESEIPSITRLSVPRQDLAYTPPIRVRETFYYHAFDPYFAIRNRMNGSCQHIPKTHGGHHRILGWCHTFFPLLPPKTYFAEHPEWYSLIDGKRVDDGQLCLTNEEMRGEFIRNALEWIRADPEAGIISISQNDWRDPCECSECGALVEKEGSQAGPIIDFVNAVAEAVEREYPDFLVMTLAYSYTRKAPAHIRPRKNVAVRLCSIECDFSKPLASGPRNRDFLRDIEEWSEIAPHLYIWNYVTNFSQFLLPHPNWDGLAPDLRLFVKHQAIGVFEQGDRRSTCGDFQALRPWLLARLLWDPEQDPEALIREFLDGYYGPAGAFLWEYISITREAVRKADINLNCFRRTTADWLELRDLNRITRRLDQAALAVAHDARFERRLNTARMPVDYVWLRRYNALAREAESERLSFLGPDDPVAARDAFLRKIHLLDCAEFGEGHPFQGAVPGLSRLFMSDHLVPLNYQSLDRDDYVYRPARNLQLIGGAAAASLVGDPIATGGYAVRISADVSGRQVRCFMDPEMQGIGRVRGYARLRVDARSSAGPACAVGIYDLRRNGELCRESIRIEDLSPDGYVSVPIPREGIHLDRYFFVESLPEAKSVDAIYVEGFLVANQKKL